MVSRGVHGFPGISKGVPWVSLGFKGVQGASRKLVPKQHRPTQVPSRRVPAVRRPSSPTTRKGQSSCCRSTTVGTVGRIGNHMNPQNILKTFGNLFFSHKGINTDSVCRKRTAHTPAEHEGMSPSDPCAPFKTAFGVAQASKCAKTEARYQWEQLTGDLDPEGWNRGGTMCLSTSHRPSTRMQETGSPGRASRCWGAHWAHLVFNRIPLFPDCRSAWYCCCIALLQGQLSLPSGWPGCMIKGSGVPLQVSSRRPSQRVALSTVSQTTAHDRSHICILEERAYVFAVKAILAQAFWFKPFLLKPVLAHTGQESYTFVLLRRRSVMRKGWTKVEVPDGWLQVQDLSSMFIRLGSQRRSRETRRRQVRRRQSVPPDQLRAAASARHLSPFWRRPRCFLWSNRFTPWRSIWPERRNVSCNTMRQLPAREALLKAEPTKKLRKL